MTQPLKPRFLAIAAIGAAVSIACFSDRDDATQPPSGDCNVALDSALLGTPLISIRGFAFQPTEVRVRRGTTVTWVNCSDPSDPGHTSTSDNGIWSSPLLPAGAFFSQTFNEVGSFPFHCEPHPFMTGVVVVEE